MNCEICVDPERGIYLSYENAIRGSEDDPLYVELTRMRASEYGEYVRKNCRDLSHLDKFSTKQYLLFTKQVKITIED